MTFCLSCWYVYHCFGLETYLDNIIHLLVRINHVGNSVVFLVVYPPSIFLFSRSPTLHIFPWRVLSVLLVFAYYFDFWSPLLVVMCTAICVANHTLLMASAVISLQV